MSYITDVIGEQHELVYPEYRNDSERISRLAASHGVMLTVRQAEQVWEKFSDSMAAGWMMLPESDDELWSTISS